MRGLPAASEIFFDGTNIHAGTAETNTTMKTRTLNIYLADDDLDDCTFFSNALEKAAPGSQLVAVHDGQALLVALRAIKAPPDLIVLDINMPVMDGYDCMRNLKADPLLREIPVAVLTTSSAEYDIERLFSLGANLFASKPGTYAGLVALVGILAGTDWKAGLPQPGRDSFRISV